MHEKARTDLEVLSFAMDEVRLFLDTHPNNKEAARRLEEYSARAAKLKKEFEEKFGPLGETSQNTSRWEWVSDPWPWEKEGN